jgi:hypothetical protein
MEVAQKYLPHLLVFLGTFAIIFMSIPELLTSPNDFLLISEGDGLKSYYVFDYQLKHRDSLNHFSGLNYPYGENYLFTDGFPALQYVIQFFPFLYSYSAGIIHATIVIGFLLTSYFLFKILLFYTKNHWLSILGALSLFTLQPQFYRLFGHLSMSYSCFIPMAWYFLIRFMHDKKKLKWILLLFITNTLWYFTHGYLGLMLTVFLGGVLIFQPKIWKDKLNLLSSLSFTALPLLIFFILSKWSDSISDRTTEPFGFFEYQSHWKSVFLTPNGFIGAWMSKYISFENLNWEGTSYIGFTSIVILISLLFFRIIKVFKPNSNELFPKEILLFLFSSFLLLLYSFGIPFNQFPSLLDVLWPLKQFRAVGRFAWPFYFVCGILSFCVLHNIYRVADTKWKKIAAISLVSFGSALYFIEAYPVITKNKVYSKNLLKKENLPLEQQQLITFIQENKANYQCILPLPWFHVGSELYGKEPNKITMTNVILASVHTGLPIYGCMMGRTSISQSHDFFRSLGSKFQEKSKSFMISNKDFLVWFDYQPLNAEDEQELYDLSDPIFKNKYGELRSLSVDKIFNRSKVEKTNFINAETHKQSDFLFENYQNKNNRLIAKASNFNTFAKFDKNQLKPDHLYEVSFDYFWKGSKNMDNVLRIEYVKNKQVTWFYERTICSFTDQLKDQVRVRAVFKTQADSYAYNLFLFGGEKKKQEYEIDNVLIRPLDLNAIWKNEKGAVFINSFQLK